MSETPIPENADVHVARVAIAWEIVARSFAACSQDDTEEANKLLEEYIRRYKKVYEGLF